MPKCAVCKKDAEEGITVMDRSKKNYGKFYCWSCWYKDAVVTEDETTKTIDNPQLGAIRTRRR